MAEGTQDALAFGPDVRIGFLGGGQLGRMTIQAALDLDMRIEVLDPDPQCPCARIAHQFTQGDLNDAEAVIAWGRSLDVVTVEIENVSTEGLTALKAMGVKVLPDPAHLAMIRDKGIQKQFYAEHGIPTSDFALVEDGRAESMSRGLPVVQKLRTGGYDGRGVQVIRTEEEARYAFDAPSVLEDAVDIEKELSVIVARSTSGEVKTYPVVESVFNALNLVDYLVAPARISEAVEAEARASPCPWSRPWTLSGCWRWSCSWTRRAESWSTKWPPAPTIQATTPSKPVARPNSNSISAPFWACPSGTLHSIRPQPCST